MLYCPGRRMARIMRKSDSYDAERSRLARTARRPRPKTARLSPVAVPIPDAASSALLSEGKFLTTKLMTLCGRAIVPSKVPAIRDALRLTRGGERPQLFVRRSVRPVHRRAVLGDLLRTKPPTVSVPQLRPSRAELNSTLTVLHSSNLSAAVHESSSSPVLQLRKGRDTHGALRSQHVTRSHVTFFRPARPVPPAAPPPCR